LLNDYAASVAGKSRMGIYMAATAPIMFVSKFPAGWLSGWLLARYCPSNPSAGPCDTVALWMIISIVTLVSSPLMLTLFYNIIYDPVVRSRWNRDIVNHYIQSPNNVEKQRLHYSSNDDTSESSGSASVSGVELNNHSASPSTSASHDKDSTASSNALPGSNSGSGGKLRSRTAKITPGSNSGSGKTQRHSDSEL
jgi:hypothetical protein